MRRRRGPGLIGTMARTAVIAGTASSVANSTNARAAAQAQTRAEGEAAKAQLAAQQHQAQVDAAVQRALEQQAAASGPAPVAAPAASAPALGAQERIAALQQLAQLHAQGILSDAELATEKARILA